MSKKGDNLVKKYVTCPSHSVMVNTYISFELISRTVSEILQKYLSFCTTMQKQTTTLAMAIPKPFLRKLSRQKLKFNMRRVENIVGNGMNSHSALGVIGD